MENTTNNGTAHPAERIVEAVCAAMQVDGEAWPIVAEHLPGSLPLEALNGAAAMVTLMVLNDMQAAMVSSAPRTMPSVFVVDVSATTISTLADMVGMEREQFVSMREQIAAYFKEHSVRLFGMEGVFNAGTQPVH